MATKRFHLRGSSNWTWSIIDIFTDLPLIIDDQVMTNLDEVEAIELLDLLNSIDLQRRKIFEQQ